MANIIIERIAGNAAESIKALIIESEDKLRRDLQRIIAGTPDTKKAVLRLSHMIIVDIDSGEQKDSLSWSVSNRIETSSKADIDTSQLSNDTDEDEDEDDGE